MFESRWRKFVLGTALVGLGSLAGFATTAQAIPIFTGGAPFAVPFAAPAFGSYTLALAVGSPSALNSCVIFEGRDGESPYASTLLTFPAGAMTGLPNGLPAVRLTYRPRLDEVFLTPWVAGGSAASLGQTDLTNEIANVHAMTETLQQCRASGLAGAAWSVRVWVDPATLLTATIRDGDFYTYQIGY